MFHIVMARLSHGIGACLFMACLGHVSSLTLKWKSNWNYMKTIQNMIWEH